MNDVERVAILWPSPNQIKAIARTNDAIRILPSCVLRGPKQLSCKSVFCKKQAVSDTKGDHVTVRYRSDVVDTPLGGRVQNSCCPDTVKVLIKASYVELAMS